MKLKFQGANGKVSIDSGNIIAVNEWWTPEGQKRADLVLMGGMTLRVQDLFEDADDRVKKAKAQVGP